QRTSETIDKEKHYAATSAKTNTADIKDETVTLLQPRLADLRQALESMLDTLTTQAQQALEQIESQAQREIDTVLAVEVDDALIAQLQVETPKLLTILNSKD
ncbi:hypothetical protein, partial [Staphylococcus pseudintermedius]|uniref:hypothetical protein n=1 Tax=Staphylococcus pseudintermedius TaxID=283734 RepID=UPI0036F35BED